MGKKYEHTPSMSEYLKNLIKPVKHSTPLKRSLSGYEIELTLVDDQGKVVNKADKIIKDCKKDDKEFPVKKEPGKNMLETCALPHSNIKKTSLYLINNVEKVLDSAEKHGSLLYPFATYPGKFEAKIFPEARYKYSRQAIGEEKYNFSCSHTFGFHYHYTMPRGVFDPETKFLQKKIYSKVKKTLIDSYNFMIAADPVLTTLTQSSPFAEGKYYAKDTRMLFFRGGKKLKYMEGLFAKHQLLGGLPPYKQTMADLISTLNKKDAKFKKMLRKHGAPQSFIDEKQKLDYIWNPVKINKAGTLEQRGMDSNHLDVCLGACVMMKFILRAIQQEFYHVIPSDIGEEEPFKLEGNAIFVPPHTTVRNKWQYKSAYQGLSDKDIKTACNNFYKTAKKLVYKRYIPALKPIKEILDKERTVSDIMIDYVKRKGHSLENELPEELVTQLVTLHSGRMRKNLEKTKKIYADLI